VLENAIPESIALLKGDGFLGALYAELRSGHNDQWECEDQCRLEAGNRKLLDVLKRRIDVLNDRRMQLVREIDGAISISTAHGRPLVLTIGQYFDRIAIAEVRLAHVGAASAADALQDLCAAWDHDRRDLLAGLRRPPRGTTQKFYAGPQSV
jgi:hypothetical protein